MILTPPFRVASSLYLMVDGYFFFPPLKGSKFVIYSWLLENQLGSRCQEKCCVNDNIKLIKIYWKFAWSVLTSNVFTYKWKACGAWMVTSLYLLNILIQAFKLTPCYFSLQGTRLPKCINKWTIVFCVSFGFVFCFCSCLKIPLYPLTHLVHY